jgi:hypothetical protein
MKDCCKTEDRNPTKKKNKRLFNLVVIFFLAAIIVAIAFQWFVESGF